MAIESYVHRINQERDYREALFDRIAELVIANYNAINPDVPLEQIQQVLRDGTVEKRGVVQGSESAPVVIFEKDKIANSSDMPTFDTVVNYFSQNEEMGEVDVTLIGMNVNTLSGEIFLTAPGKTDLQVGVNELENLFLNDNASQFITFSTEKNLLHLDKALEYLETQINEFKPKYHGDSADVLRQRIKKLFQDFDAIKKQMIKGETFQEGTKLNFIDKSAVTLNYLIKQCIDRIYDIKCIFTEEQYSTLLDQYNNLNTEYKMMVSSSMNQLDVGVDTIESKTEVVNEMTNVVFPQVLTSFQVDTYWKNRFSDAIQVFVKIMDLLYSKIQRNIIGRDAWKFKPRTSNPSGNSSNPIHWYGWDIYQNRRFNNTLLPTLNQLQDAEEVGYTEFPSVNGVYGGGMIDSQVTFHNSQFNDDHDNQLQGDVVTENVHFQPGCIRCEPQLFYYINPRGNRYPINAKNAIISTMANEPYITTEQAENVYLTDEGAPEIYNATQDQIIVYTGDNDSPGVVTEAYIMFVGSDKSRFEGNESSNQMWNNNFSSDFIVVYRGGGVPAALFNEGENLPFYTNPGYSNYWYWDNGFGFNINRKFIPNENDAIVARLYRNDSNSIGIDSIDIESYTQVGNTMNENSLIPFTLHQSFWASSFIPAEFTFRCDPLFNGETHDDYDSLHLVHSPPSNVNHNNFNLESKHFKSGQNHTVSLYVKTESETNLVIQPYISVYSIEPMLNNSGDPIEGWNTYTFEEDVIVSTPKIFNKQDGWKRISFQDVTVPQLGIEATPTYTVNFRFMVDTTNPNNSPEEGNSNQYQTFSENFKPEISVAALQVETGDFATAWRKPSETLQADTLEETPSVAELTTQYSDESAIINETLQPVITEDEFEMHDNGDLLSDIPADNVDGYTLLNKLSFIDDVSQLSFKAGNIIKVEGAGNSSLEYMMIVDENAYGNGDVFQVMRGVFGTDIVSHSHFASEQSSGYFEMFEIELWALFGDGDEDEYPVTFDTMEVDDSLTSALISEIGIESANENGNIIVAADYLGAPNLEQFRESGRILRINSELLYVRFYEPGAGGGIIGLTRAIGGTLVQHHSPGSIIYISEETYDF